jgi:hypothetical protein
MNLTIAPILSWTGWPLTRMERVLVRESELARRSMESATKRMAQVAAAAAANMVASMASVRV